MAEREILKMKSRARDSFARGSRDDLGRNSQGTYVVNVDRSENVLAFCAPDPSLNVTKLLKP